MQQVTMIEGIGIPQFGGTYSRREENGTPTQSHSSAIRLWSISDSSELPSRSVKTEHTLIASKGPQLPGCGCHLADASRQEDHDDNSNHDRRSSLALRSIIEDLDDWLVGITVQSTLDVSQAEDVRDAHDQEQDSITSNGPDDDIRDGLGGILGLLRHVDAAIISLRTSQYELKSIPLLPTHNQHADRRNHANGGCKRYGLPSTARIEFENRLVNISSRRHNPKRDDDDENSQNMQNQDQDLDQRQAYCQEDVEQSAEDRDGDRQRRAMPVLQVVVRVVELRKTEDKSSLKISQWIGLATHSPSQDPSQPSTYGREGNTSKECLPSHGDQPASGIAQYFLEPRRGELRYPMVLASSGRTHGGDLRQTRIYRQQHNRTQDQAPEHRRCTAVHQTEWRNDEDELPSYHDRTREPQHRGELELPPQDLLLSQHAHIMAIIICPAILRGDMVGDDLVSEMVLLDREGLHGLRHDASNRRPGRERTRPGKKGSRLFR